jgi:hypothetical protein
MSRNFEDETPERKALKAVLMQHGFETASRHLSDRDYINYRTALASWKNFPSSMEIYPKIINRPTWK